MRKNSGFVAVAAVLIVLAGGLYYFYSVNIRKPDQESSQIAELIFRYPNASLWIVDTKGGFCFYFDKNCKPNAKIIFETDDPWPGIYNYYKSYLTSGGWQSNSLILTSLPGSIVFTDGASCKIEISPTSSGIINKSQHNRYKIGINCAA
ncbi:hypothetical protein HY382_03175 [Candidatus Curtissbacteria bacterium]|nr:hypothetical protein [Candidatus Curtissbacteria bacterium]